ncbi:MAG TPA: glycosyltransferase [Solirubrobacteraceae bacterium]|nr:glycosyltransferase [Solirubrobacteraceae bacterium]
MKLSAIIPTHDRPDQVRRCLETLCAQEVDPSRLELIVVDDGSTTNIGRIVAELDQRTPLSLRCERQEMAGLNSARNRGAAAADGSVLAFLDDDTLVCPGWAQALLEAFSDPECAGLGGKVELELPGGAPPWLAGRTQYLAEYDLGPEARWLHGDPRQGGDPLPVGANCGVRHRDFDRLGGFRPGLDRIGTSLVSNGDTDFFRRLRASGGALRYEPGARVLHCVGPERLTARYFARRHYSQGVSDELLLAYEGQPFNWRHRLGLTRMLARTGTLLARDLLGGRGRVNGLLEISYWLGRLTTTARAHPGPGA